MKYKAINNANYGHAAYDKARELARIINDKASQTGKQSERDICDAIAQATDCGPMMGFLAVEEFD